MTVEVAEKPKAVHLLPATMPRNFGLAENKARRWRAELTEEQTIAQAQETTFWRHVADGIMGHDKAAPYGRGDIIELFKLDTSEYVEMLIVEIGAGFVKTRLISHSNPDEVALSEKSPLTTKWNVGKRCHEVVRKTDGNAMSSGFQTKQGAAEWIEKHLKAMAA